MLFKEIIKMGYLVILPMLKRLLKADY